MFENHKIQLSKLQSKDLKDIIEKGKKKLINNKNQQSLMLYRYACMHVNKKKRPNPKGTIQMKKKEKKKDGFGQS